MSERIAVTGLGTLTAAGGGIAAVADAMDQHADGYFVGAEHRGSLPWPVAAYDPEAVDWPTGGPWDAARKYANNTARVAVTVARQALATTARDQPLVADPFRGATVVSISSSGGDELSEVMPALALKARGDRRTLPKFLYDMVPDYSYIRGIPSQMGQFVSMANGLRGSNVAVYGETGVNGLGALAVARRLIATGEADVAMVVGVSARPTASGLVPLERDEAFAEKAGPGSGPFDAGRNGTLVGHAAAAIVIEREDAARDRGADILAYLDRCVVMSAQDRRAALDCALSAVDAPARPDVWVAHGSGSVDGDRAAFEVGRTHLTAPVTTPNGTIGTAVECAGLIDVALGVETLRRQHIPPIGSVSVVDPRLVGLDAVVEQARPLAGAGTAVVTGWNHGRSSAAGVAVLGAAVAA